MQKQFDKAASLIQNAEKIIALTGAGVSTESGIPDFRSKGGLWSRFDPMEYGTIGAFRRDPVKVWTMLSELLFVVDAKPNSGHEAMARMERAGLLHGIVTQNIDGLHQKAGSCSVVEFHGSMATFSCMSCGASFVLDEVLIMELPPRCGCGEVLKPDVVFFDEVIPSEALSKTENMISTADVLIVAGTSCQVAPASSIPLQVKQQGGVVIEMDLDPALETMADISLAGKFTKTMSMLVAALDI